MKTTGIILVVTLAVNLLQAQEQQPVESNSAYPPASASPGTPANSLRMNFRRASLETVLNYLSEAAGYVIVLEAQPTGKLDVWSEQPVSKDEALDLLNSALLRNGCAAIRKGRILTIVRRDEAKTRSLPVKMGAKPEGIPETDELVTQIIPIRFTEAAQLIPVLQPLVSLQTTMTANESANTIVITDTQANIHRLALVIEAVDGSAEDFTAVRVFHLKNANSAEMADVLTQLFPDESRSQTGSPQMQMGGPGGFSGGPGGGPFGGPGAFPGGGGFGPPGSDRSANTSTGSQAQRVKSRAKVTAVADQRTQSLVVTASRDLIPQIEAVVDQLDTNRAGKQRLAVYQLKNASATALAKVLQDAFQKNGTTSTRNTTTETDTLENRANQQQQQYNSSANNRGFSGTGQRGLGGTGGGGGSGVGGQ